MAFENKLQNWRRLPYRENQGIYLRPWKSFGLRTAQLMPKHGRRLVRSRSGQVGQMRWAMSRLCILGDRQF